MTNKGVIDRILGNLGITNESGKDIMKVRQDIEDEFVNITGLAEAPRKIWSFNVAKTEDLVEDFADSSLLTGISLSEFAVSGGKAVLASDKTGVITYANLDLINTLSFTVIGVEDTPGTDPAGTVKVYDEAGETELFSDTFDITTSEVTISKSITLSGCNLQIQITVVNPSNWTSVSIDDLTLNIDSYRQLLPSNFLVPLEVKFTSAGKQYISKEMTFEEYMLWQPLTFDTDDVMEIISGISDDDDIMTYNSTEENYYYDRKIGFVFNVESDGTYIYWKPVLEGICKIAYSSLDVPSTLETASVTVHRAFIDLLAYGGTLRGLTRKLNEDNITEIKIAAIRTQISIYQQKYDKKLADYTGFVNRTADNNLVRPYNIVSDSGMELI